MSNGDTFTVGNGVDKKDVYGITISTDTPGGYRIYAQNDNDYTITVSGVVNISKV